MKVKTNVVENFIGSMDKSLPIVAHIRNAQADAKMYGWNTETLLQVTEQILKSYLKV